MANIWVDVDTAITVPVNICPLIDDTDFKSREVSITFDQAGMDLVWNFQTTAGVQTQTAVTPTTAGDYDWTHVGDAMYKIEIPASGGVSINNDAEGFGWFTGFATGVLPWCGPIIGFRAAALNNALIDGGDSLDVNTIEISGDAGAANNLELQYDTTGLSGDTFPATQAQVSQIGSGGGAANNEFVIAAPSGFVLTTGSGEVNDEDATVAVGGLVHQISDTAGTMDGYYLFDIGGSFTPRNIVHEGRSNGNNQDLNVMVNTNTQASPTWVQRATLLGSALSTNIRRVWPLAAGDLMVGADAGKVAVRFQNTGLSSATLTTDQVLVEKGSIASLVGYANGQVWVDTVDGVAGTVVDVNGVADNPVLTWADALTIATSKGLSDFHILNGSTIALTGNSDNFSLFGDNWTLQLEGRSVAGAYFQGAHVSGVGVSATEVHYEGCDVATMSVQIGHFDFCSFSGTVTHTLAGDYNYHNCYSMVPGPNGPTWAKTAGQAITSQWRGWKGSTNQTGLEVGDTMTIGGDEMGTIDLGSPAGAVVVEIRGMYKALANAGSAAVNLDGAVLASDVALILGDTNELQGVLSAGILARSNNPNLNALLGVDDAASKTIAHTIWDRILSKANHDIAQSAAKLLRQLASFVIANNDARVTGSPGINQIQLAATESSVDGTFDPGIVGIIDGTGAGQCRMILEYNGTSKIATLNRDWKVAPDATSEYVILCSEGGLHVNEGLAQGGSSTTITLNVLASTSDRVYEGQFVFLVSGTGQDQVGRVTNYVGATRVATIETVMNGWVTAPDATTGYIMIPTLDIVPTLLGTPIALDGAAATIAAMLTKMADDSGGSGFNAGLHSLQKILERGNAAWTTGAGGDATEAKQDAIIVDLDDIKGTAFVKDTNSLVDLGRTGADGDTLKSLSDQIDGIVGGTGTGARTVAVTVNDGAAVLENASVRFTEGANTFAGPTDASGEISFSLDDATYAVAVSKAGYTFTPTTLVVDGDKTPTYSMALVVPSAPPSATTTTGVATVHDFQGNVEGGVTVTVQILAGPGTDGLGYDSEPWAVTSNGSGLVEFAGLFHGGRYEIWRGTSKTGSKTFTAPTTGTSFDLTEFIGRG